MSLSIRIVAAWVLGLIALVFAGWAGDYLVATYQIGARARFGSQAAIMSGIVLPGIWYLRTRHDLRPFAGLAMLGLGRSLRGFGLGAGLILVPTVVTVLFTDLFGWATVSLNRSEGVFTAIAAGIATAFFFEALPEELIFRGYIFRNLNTVMRRWTAGAVTVGLFVLLPIVAVQAQEHVLGMEVQIGGTNRITMGFLAILFLFATFLQYLRVLTGTVWAGIGFHLFFLMANRIGGCSRIVVAPVVRSHDGRADAGDANWQRVALLWCPLSFTPSNEAQLRLGRGGP